MIAKQKLKSLDSIFVFILAIIIITDVAPNMLRKLLNCSLIFSVCCHILGMLCVHGITVIALKHINVVGVE